MNVARRILVQRARIVISMGMPAFVYRWYFRAHGLKSLRRITSSLVASSRARLPKGQPSRRPVARRCRAGIHTARR